MDTFTLLLYSLDHRKYHNTAFVLNKKNRNIHSNLMTFKRMYLQYLKDKSIKED